MKVIGSLVLAMLCATSAFAQSSTDVSAPAGAVQRLKLPLMVWAAGATADQITTYQFSSGYGEMIREQNPMIRRLDRHPVLLITAGAAIDAGSAWLSYRLLRNHPRVAQAVFYGAASYRAYLAVHNMHMMQIADGMRARGVAATSSPVR